MTFEQLKQLPKEEFLKLEGATEELYNALQDSIPGYITITHQDRGDKHYGWTSGFGEGLSLRIDNSDRWYVTSVIQKIDWESNTFTTLNSTYNFSFKPTQAHESEEGVSNSSN